MLPRSPSAGVAEKLVFGNSLEETMPPPPIAGSPTADIQDNAETRVSMYVSLFEGASASTHMLAAGGKLIGVDMLATVLRHEHYLLTLSEIDYLARYSKMSCACLRTSNNVVSPLPREYRPCALPTCQALLAQDGQMAPAQFYQVRGGAWG